MHMVYVTPGIFDKGGIARYCQYQVRALREDFGQDAVAVFSLAGRTARDLETDVAVTFAGAWPLTPLAKALFSAELARYVLSRRPRIIGCAHLHLAPLVAPLAAAVGARWFVNIYGWEIWPQQGVSRLRAWGLRRASCVIADCHNTADQAVALGLLRHRPHVVWDCVDTARFTPGPPDWKALAAYGVTPDDRFTVVYLSRLGKAAWYKGVGRAIDLVAALGEGFRLVIGGQGDCVSDIAAYAARAGIAERCIFTGPIHDRDLPDFYRCGDVFYLASEVGDGKGEGIPLTPMEAMACGTPVVVGDQDGSRELLDGDGGWCGDPHDIEAQAAYVRSLAASPRARDAAARAAADRAHTAFAFGSFKEHTVSIVNGLL